MKSAKTIVTKTARKSVAKVAKKSAAKSTIRGAGWKRAIKIDEEKFQAISTAILASLDTKPVKFYDLVRKVEAKLRNFPGSVAWYSVTTLRELETQGKVIRTVGKPTTYQLK